MEKINGEKYVRMETFFDQARINDLQAKKMDLYLDKARGGKVLDNWLDCVVLLKPEHRGCFMFHYLNGSSLAVGDCQVRDLEGDYSAEQFLEAESETREEIVKRLLEELEKQGMSIESKI